ncbi:MAG: hypothetical protein Q7J05_06070 [Paludibacter sp.]|nr:hypothetical protein [Paludibacter sp.]
MFYKILNLSDFGNLEGLFVDVGSLVSIEPFVLLDRPDPNYLLTLQDINFFFAEN